MFSDPASLRCDGHVVAYFCVGGRGRGGEGERGRGGREKRKDWRIILK